MRPGRSSQTSWRCLHQHLRRRHRRPLPKVSRQSCPRTVANPALWQFSEADDLAVRSEPLKIKETQSGVEGLLSRSRMARCLFDASLKTIWAQSRSRHAARHEAELPPARQPQPLVLQVHGTDISLQKPPAGHLLRCGSAQDWKTKWQVAAISAICAAC
jgi:hypothetical protein